MHSEEGKPTGSALHITRKFSENASGSEDDVEDTDIVKKQMFKKMKVKRIRAKKCLLLLLDYLGL